MKGKLEGGKVLEYEVELSLSAMQGLFTYMD